MGALFVKAGRRVMAFGPSGLVDRPFDHLYVCTIPLYGYIDIRVCYILFSSQALLSIW